MKQFALIVDGRIAELVPEFITVGDGDEAINVPIAERYHPDFVAQLVEYDPENPPTQPETVPAPAPTTASMRQARLALLQAGHYSAVQQAVAALPGAEGDAARIEWEFAATVDRASPMVSLIAAALDLNEAEIDELFAVAVTL